MIDLVDAYTRADAIDDGVLVDVTGAAAVAGLTLPTALTAAAHDERGCDDADQLARVLQAVRIAATLAPSDTDRVHLDLRGARGGWVDAWALVGPGDDARPVLTVMLAAED